MQIWMKCLKDVTNSIFLNGIKNNCKNKIIRMKLINTYITEKFRLRDDTKIKMNHEMPEKHIKAEFKYRMKCIKFINDVDELEVYNKKTLCVIKKEHNLIIIKFKIQNNHPECIKYDFENHRVIYEEYWMPYHGQDGSYLTKHLRKKLDEDKIEYKTNTVSRTIITDDEMSDTEKFDFVLKTILEYYKMMSPSSYSFINV